MMERPHYWAGFGREPGRGTTLAERERAIQALPA